MLRIEHLQGRKPYWCWKIHQQTLRQNVYKYHFSTLRRHKLLKVFSVDERELFNLLFQYHCWRWPDATRSQNTSCWCIDLATALITYLGIFRFQQHMNLGIIQVEQDVCILLWWQLRKVWNSGVAVDCILEDDIIVWIQSKQVFHSLGR